MSVRVRVITGQPLVQVGIGTCSIIAAAMGKEAARGALSPDSLAVERARGRAKYAIASARAVAKGTTLSKQL
jgi:hypothetical protein